MKKIADVLLGIAEESIDLCDVLDMNASGRDQRQGCEAAGIAHRKLGGHPAAQRLPDQMDAVETEFLEKIEIEVREVGDGVEPWRRVEAAEPGRSGEIHANVAGNPLNKGNPRP